MIGVLKANPGLAIALALMIAVPVILTLVYLILGGGAARPVLFIATLMAIILLPFGIGQLVLAKRPGLITNSVPELATAAGRFADPRAVFGPDVDTTLIQDVRAVFPDILVDPEVAQLTTFPTGETVIAARFATLDAAEQAGGNYWRAYQITNTSGSEEAGWRGKRALVGDFMEMYRTGPYLFIWTGADRESLHQRRLTGLRVSAKAVSSDPLLPALQPLGALFAPVGVKIAGLLVLVLLYSVIFFKGAVWAGRKPAAAASPAAASELRARLLALHAGGARISGADSGATVIVEWGDSHRFELALDESDHTVRVTERRSEPVSSTGPAGTTRRWKTARGIIFANTGSAVQETVKRPLTEVVTGAGWTWQPVLIRMPKALRWLE